MPHTSIAPYLRAGISSAVTLWGLLRTRRLPHLPTRVLLAAPRPLLGQNPATSPWPTRHHSPCKLPGEEEEEEEEEEKHNYGSSAMEETVEHQPSTPRGTEQQAPGVHQER